MFSVPPPSAQFPPPQINRILAVDAYNIPGRIETNRMWRLKITPLRRHRQTNAIESRVRPHKLSQLRFPAESLLAKYNLIFRKTSDCVLPEDNSLPIYHLLPFTGLL